MSLPGVGAKGADKILEMREVKGDLELEDLRFPPFDGTLLSCPQSFPIPGAGSGPVPSHSSTNWSTLLTRSLCRSSRDQLESSSDERDRAYMHDFQIRDSDIRAGYAFPRGPGLPHSGVLASQRGNETDGDFDCPRADLLLYPPGVGLSMKAASSSLCSSSNLSGDCCHQSPFCLL
jgi:hypothetical protein